MLQYYTIDSLEPNERDGKLVDEKKIKMPIRRRFEALRSPHQAVSDLGISKIKHIKTYFVQCQICTLGGGRQVTYAAPPLTNSALAGRNVYPGDLRMASYGAFFGRFFRAHKIVEFST